MRIRLLDHFVSRWWVCGCLAFLPACGAPSTGNEREDAAGTVDSESEAVQTSYDAIPAVAHVMYDINGQNPKLWVLACNTNHHLVRRIHPSGGGSWTAIEDMDPDCGAPPALAGFGYPGAWLIENTQSDHHLWGVQVDENGTIDLWKALSDITNLGPVAGTPVFNGSTFQGDFGAISVAVKSDSNRVVTLSYSSGRWQYRFVTKSDGSKITTTNSLNPFLAGRGTTGSDDSVGWIADGPYDGPWTVTGTFSGISGTPARAWVNGTAYIVARFGSALKYATSPNGPWTSLSSCSVGGSPIDPNGDSFGYVRGSSGELVKWDLVAKKCTSHGGNLSSAPSPVFRYQNGGDSFTGNVVYRGVSGNLWYFDVSAGGQHTNLGIAVPAP